MVRFYWRSKKHHKFWLIFFYISNFLSDWKYSVLSIWIDGPEIWFVTFGHWRRITTYMFTTPNQVFFKVKYEKVKFFMHFYQKFLAETNDCWSSSSHWFSYMFTSPIILFQMKKISTSLAAFILELLTLDFYALTSGADINQKIRFRLTLLDRFLCYSILIIFLDNSV